MTLLTTTTCTISCRLLPLMTFDKTILFTIKEYRKVTAIKKKDWMLVKYFIVALIFMIRFLKNGKSTLSFHGKLTPKHNGIIMHVIFKYLYAIQFVDNAFGPKSSDEINLKLTVKLQF